MNWMKWITGWFGGATKSMGSLGVGLKSALSGGAPGGWASDHREETAHNTGFNYIAIHAIAAQVAGATVSVFSDGDLQTLRQSRRKSLAARVGSFARWKSTYGADDRETDPLPTTHPLVRLLKRPNSYESGANFRYRQAQQMRLTGTCLIWNVPSMSGVTCERYVIPTAMASPVAPTMELPRGGWRINPVASRYTPIVDDGYVDCPSWYLILGQIIDARQVQLIRLPHAWYLDDGQSPLSAGAKWVDAGEAVDDARYHQLKNGIDPSVVWNLPPDVSPDQDEIDRVQAKISAKYGGPENVGRVMVAQSGTTITPLSATPKDMCYTEGFQDFKAAVLALHQTPPVAVGLQEPGAYAAYNASMKAWRHSAIQPLCDMLAESDTEHLAPQFGPGLTIEIESDTVDDTELIEQQLQNDLAAKVRTKNEWRAVRGMPPLPGSQGDELVGTDSSQDANRSSTLAPKPSGATQSSDTNDLGTQSKSGRLPDGSCEITKRRFSTGSHTTSNEPFGQQDDGSETNSPLQKPASGEVGEEDNDRSRAELIADILYGLYGDSALSVLEAASEPSQKTFNPDLHPRNRLGQFSRNGTAEEIAAARQAISEVLQKPFHADIKDPKHTRVVDALCLLSRSDLESLHREHGFTAPPKQRERLVESIMVRLPRPYGLSDDDVRPVVYGRHVSTDRINVYVQHADDLNRIMGGKQITSKQWKGLVGAQPGARVYVYSAGSNSIQISVQHPDYSAQRKITPTQIENEVFGVVKEKQGKGLGLRILKQQVKTAAKLGIKSIIVGANGEGAKLRGKSRYSLSGYNAWARMGFDGLIAPLLKDRIEKGTAAGLASVRDFQTRFPRVTKVSEMMLTQERRDWWRNYGGYFEGTFDLTKGSRSWKILNDYIAEKAEEKKKPTRPETKSRFTSVPISGQVQDEDTMLHGTDADAPIADANGLPDDNTSWGENPDPLPLEDEEILDRIWDKLGREMGLTDSKDAGQQQPQF